MARRTPHGTSALALLMQGMEQTIREDDWVCEVVVGAKKWLVYPYERKALRDVNGSHPE